MDFVSMIFRGVTYIFLGLCKNPPSSNYKKTGIMTRLFQPELKMAHFQPKDPQCLLHTIYICTQFKKTLIFIKSSKFSISDKIVIWTFFVTKFPLARFLENLYIDFSHYPHPNVSMPILHIMHFLNKR